MNKITQRSRPKPEESSLHRRRRSRWNRLHRLVIGVYSAVLLSSCSGLAQVSSSTSALSEAYPGALSGESQLVAGTLLLEETDLAVTGEQASELHLLWMAFRSLNSSETSAQAEIDAVLAQIEDSMSSEQLEAIAGMQLTSEDMSELSARYTVRTADSTDSIAVDGLSGAQVGPAGGAPPDGGGPAGALGVGVPGRGRGGGPRGQIVCRRGACRVAIGLCRPRADLDRDRPRHWVRPHSAARDTHADSSSRASAVRGRPAGRADLRPGQAVHRYRVGGVRGPDRVARTQF